MSLPRSRYRRTAVALVAAGAAATVAVPGSLPGRSTAEPLAGPVLTTSVQTAPVVQSVAAPAPTPAVGSAPVEPAPVPPASAPAEPTPPGPALQPPSAQTPAAAPAPAALDDGLTGPAEAVLEGVPAPEVEPVRVVAQTVDADGRPDWQVFEADSQAEAVAAVEAARAVPDVERVAVDTPVQAFEVSRYNDPYRSQQWALDTLRAEEAASRSTGRGVTVAVVDTGVRADHEDFAAGTVLPGRNYVNDGRGTYGTVDPHGHGTHVAGILAATRNNARGVAGLADATILPLRVLGADGSGMSSTIATAIRDAADQGAEVINLSLGGPAGYDPFLTAVEYARSKGAVVVAAAGNTRQSGDPVNYPAATPGVLTVAASTSSGTTASFSSTGPHVEVAAPGASIAGLGIASPTSYVAMSGTSMASPLVSGAAAMLLAANPALTPTQVENALVSTATDIAAPGRDDESGAGVISPLAALQSFPAPAPAPVPAPTPTPNGAPVAAADSASTTAGTSVRVAVLANDTDPDGDALTVTALGRPANGSASLSGGVVTYTPRRSWTGADAFTYTLSDGRGGTATGRVSVTVTPKQKNRTPVARADRASTAQRAAVTVAVLGNDTDPDGDALRVTSVSRARGGTVRIVDGAVVFAPNPRFAGTTSFTYTVSDGRGGTARAMARVSVKRATSGARR